MILSGHTHDALTTAVTVGKTVITQTGRYGEHLGKLALTVTRAGGGTTVALDKYDLLAVDDSVKGDAPTQARVDQYKADINAKIMPLAYGTTVAQTSFDVLTGSGESAIGDLVTDAYRTVTAPLFPTDPPVIGIDAAGGLRANIAKGKTGAIAFADAFNVIPLGIGPDTFPGYPLVTFYLNPSDIRSGLELAAAGEVVGGDFVIQASGLTAHYDMTKGALPAHHVAADRRHDSRPHRHHAVLPHRHDVVRGQPAAGRRLGQRRHALGRAQAAGLLDSHRRHDPAGRVHRHRQHHGRAQGVEGVPVVPHVAAQGHRWRARDAVDLHGAAGAHRHAVVECRRVIRLALL